jgi:hypothetical protein
MRHDASLYWAGALPISLSPTAMQAILPNTSCGPDQY